jgi:hypothetical protein
MNTEEKAVQVAKRVGTGLGYGIWFYFVALILTFIAVWIIDAIIPLEWSLQLDKYVKEILVVGGSIGALGGIVKGFRERVEEKKVSSNLQIELKNASGQILVSSEFDPKDEASVKALLDKLGDAAASKGQNP